MAKYPRHWQLILTATVAVIAYCLAVMIQVRSTPELGIRTTFSPVVGRLYPQYLRGTSTIPSNELTGCRILQVGSHAITSNPQFHRVVRDLPTEPFTENDTNRVRRDGEEWVKVVLQRSPNETPFEIWCMLGHAPLESFVPSLLWMVLELGMLVVGVLVFWKRPDDEAAGPFFWMTLVAVGAYVGGYHWWQIVSEPILLEVFVVCAVLLPAVGLHFHHVFPAQKWWLGRRKLLTLALIYIPPLVAGALILSGYLRVRWLFRTGESIEAIQSALKWLRYSIFVSFGVSAALFVAGIACLAHSYFRAANDSERSQVKWIWFGSTLALFPIAYSLYLAFFKPLEFVGGGATWPMFIASACVTTAFTISITRYRLLRLDLLIGSSMVYFLIMFLAGLVYYVLVFTGMLLVGSQVISGPSLGQAFWVSSTALVILLVLDFARSRIRRSLEHHYRRDKHQLDRTLHQLREAIEHLVEPPTLARHLLDMSAELFRVERGALYLCEGDPPLYRLAGVLGAPPPLTELAPGCPLIDYMEKSNLLSLQDSADDFAREQMQLLGGEIALALGQEGKLLGFLVLGPKSSGYFNSEDYQLLAALAPIASLALQSAAGRRSIETLNRDLQGKLEKISEQQSRIRALQRQLGRQEGATEPTSEAAPSSDAMALKTAVIGSSIVVGQLLEMVRKVAASPSAVLLRGESGTGKELLAEAIHTYSPRADKPFVKVHCAALSPTLLESELFGHVKGAFTGAYSDKVGRFELANGGTLFLDEIGDISLDVQTKLLRVLQEKVIERVGSSEPVRVDVRIVAATHQNLERLIQQEKFREDLFYRLNVIPINVPPLRERREDIPELALHFLREFAAQMKRPIAEIEDDAMLAIQTYAWPGNVRQLRNAIERAIVVAEENVISLDDLPAEIQAVPSGTLIKPEFATPRSLRTSREERKRREREELLRALAEARGNKAEAARALGIPRSTLLSRMQKHGLQ